MSNLITAITSFCGRSEEDCEGWFNAVKRITNNVVCVCHDLNGDGAIYNFVPSVASHCGVSCKTINWDKPSLVLNGYSDMWNSCIHMVDTPWWITVAGDEFIDDAGNIAECCSENVDVVNVMFDCPLAADRLIIPRAFRKNSGLRYCGLIHEELVDDGGVHYTRRPSKNSSCVLRHKRISGDRGVQSVLLLKAYFNRKLRGWTNSWWFDYYVTNHFKSIYEDALRYCNVLGIDFKTYVPIDMDWDFWRSQYKSWPFNAHKVFYERVFDNYPVQDHVCKPALVQFFEKHVPQGSSVIEIGGWNGAAAKHILSCRKDIAYWNNYEICHKAALSSVCDDSRYSAIPLNDWPWNVDMPQSNVLVAAHVLEHMLAHDVEAILKRNRSIRVAFVECPINEKNTNEWLGYNGTHIIEVGWCGLEAIFNECGFEVAERLGQIRIFTKP